MEPLLRSKQPSSQQIKSILCDAIKVLCSNTISYSSCLSIEALIGVTVDNAEVMLINVQELLEKPPVGFTDVTRHSNSRCQSQFKLEPDSDFHSASVGGAIKADPSEDERFFNVLSDKVILIDDEDRAELDELQDTFHIKEEDDLGCLIDDGDYRSGVFQNASHVQGDDSFLVSGQFYSNDSMPVGENYNQIQGLSNNQKWQAFSNPSDTVRGRSVAVRANRSGTYNCRLCKKTFTSQAVYLRHKKKHLQTSMKQASASAFQGSDTAEINGSQSGISDDNWTMTSPVGRKSSILLEEVTNMTVYTCSICGKTFRHQSSFLRHKRQHEGIVYKCDLCGAVISRRDTLQVHKRKCAMKLQQVT